VFEPVAEAIKPNADIPPAFTILYPIMLAIITSNIPPMPASVINRCLSIDTDLIN
jgi:hypothetical protein